MADVLSVDVSGKNESAGRRVPAINVVFDAPPGPESGRFVEVEDDDGRSINVGEWIERPDGLWALRIEMNGSCNGE